MRWALDRASLVAAVVAVGACSTPSGTTSRSGARSDLAPLANTHVAATGDRDADGILDDTDRCPEAAEDWDASLDDDGCPDPDDDGDGFADADDVCPDEPYASARGCPPQTCTVIVADAISDCFLTEIYDAAKPLDEAALAKVVAEMAAAPEVFEVELRALLASGEPLDVGRARLEHVRERLLARGWPTRIAIVLQHPRATTDPDMVGLVLGEVSVQRFTHDARFRPGTCTLLGDVYRPERPDMRCHAGRPGVTFTRRSP